MLCKKLKGVIKNKMEDSREEYSGLIKKVKPSLPKEKGYERTVSIANKTDKAIKKYGKKLTSSHMSYKSSSPLKGLLKTKRATVTVRPSSGERINLMRGTW